MVCTMSFSRRALILVYVKLGVLIGFSGLFLVGITLFGIYFDELDKRMEGTAKEALISAIVGFILTMLFEGALLVLLFKAVKERSYKKCQIWFIINLVVFCVSFVSFLFEAFAGWPKSLTLTLLELIYDGISLKIVYDFMQELRNTRPDGDVPFQEMKNENEGGEV